jgi:hypothetical protein
VTVVDREAVAGEGDPAFDEAFRSLLGAWHHYEVIRALGAPSDEVAAAGRALQRARAEVASRRKPLSR